MVKAYKAPSLRLLPKTSLDPLRLIPKFDWKVSHRDLWDFFDPGDRKSCALEESLKIGEFLLFRIQKSFFLGFPQFAGSSRGFYLSKRDIMLSTWSTCSFQVAALPSVDEGQGKSSELKLRIIENHRKP